MAENLCAVFLEFAIVKAKQNQMQKSNCFVYFIKQVALSTIFLTAECRKKKVNQLGFGNITNNNQIIRADVSNPISGM